METEGFALLQKAAGQGHAYAMDALAAIYYAREEYERSLEWTTKAGAYTPPLLSST